MYLPFQNCCKKGKTSAKKATLAQTLNFLKTECTKVLFRWFFSFGAILFKKFQRPCAKLITANELYLGKR